MIYAFKKIGYHNLKAIDIIPECCNFVKQNLGVDVRCIDVFKFFVENTEKYDVIIAFDVIEHFNKNEIVLLVQSIYEFLNPEGIFIMRTPYGGSLRGLYIRYSGFTHEIAFTELSINELFKAVGFKEVRCLPEPNFSKNILKNFLKKLRDKFISKLFSIDQKFINSANIIGIGIKK